MPGSGQVPSPAREPEILVAILAEWVEVVEKANRVFIWVFKVWWFSSSGQVFSLSSLSLYVCFVLFFFLVNSWLRALV